jgi:glycosyltransferase involved in cell wall biosynthesis
MPTSRFSLLLGADSLAAPTAGIGRVTLEIARALQNCPEVEAVNLIIDKKVFGLDHLASLTHRQEPAAGGFRLRRMIGRLPGIGLLRDLRHSSFKRTTRQLSTSSGKKVVYHEPNMIAHPFDGPTVVTINDLSWHHEPGWHPAERVEWIKRNLPQTLARATRIVAISQFTKDAAVATLNIPADQVDVVPLAHAAEFGPQSAEAAAPVLSRLGLDDRGYVLSASTLEPRKNFDRLFDAHSQLPVALRARMPLVIVGGKGWGDVLSRPGVEAAVGSGHLRLLGHTADADLAALYARCAAFAYVSLYEGFGLPVTEAMASGAPVLASGTTAVAETAGAAALLVNPLDECAIADGLRRILEDQEFAKQLRTAGITRAAQFSWPRTMEAFMATWRAALEQH